MTQIELRGVEKYFGDVQVIKNLILTIEHNEFIVSGWNDFLRPTLDNTRLLGIGHNDDNNTILFQARKKVVRAVITTRLQREGMLAHSIDD